VRAVFEARSIGMEFSRLRWGCLGFICVGVLSLVGLYAAINVWPELGARAADWLRGVIGNEPVAQLEAVAFEAKDDVRHLEYISGIERPAAPWQAVAVEVAPTDTPVPVATSTLVPTLSPATVTPISTSTPIDVAWRPSPVISTVGTLKGEGVWTPYINRYSSEPIAYRTFIQPDKDRPYSIVAIVAFDLKQTRLHYVLGTEEPSVPQGLHGTGKIANEYRAPGVLVSAFNGGFKATHGHFGAMADGVVALPPRDGLAVVTLYDDGTVRIGEWGRDIITQTQNMVAWRENGPLIIRKGQITPRVYTNLVADWGGTLDGSVVTWRSALGLSADGRTLYYLAGSNLSMPALAKAMLAVGTYQGMLLDINPYWVHFTAIRADGDKLVADPLFPAEMKQHADRFLTNGYSRDFFYITTIRPKRSSGAQMN
jgi:hypothetical protein